MNREQFIDVMANAKLYDLTQGLSIFTPPWPGDKSCGDPMTLWVPAEAIRSVKHTKIRALHTSLISMA